jgi:hypothetical protein
MTDKEIIKNQEFQIIVLLGVIVCLLIILFTQEG